MLDGLGDRLRILRGLHHLTQQELADAAGVSKSLVSKVEAGQRPGSWDLAVAVARALRLELPALVGTSAGVSGGVDQYAACLSELRRIMAEYDCPPDLGRAVSPLSILAKRVDQAGKLRLHASYSALGLMLPPLLDELTIATRTLSGAEREQAFGLLTLGYRCADAIAHKLGYLDLSTVAIDRMRWSAGQSGDELMAATGTYVRAEAFFVAGSVESGLRLLSAAGEQIARQVVRDRRTAAVYGALHARAAVLAAFGGKASDAWTHLEVAQAMATLVGRDVEFLHTSFGPASVKVHEIAVAVELSDPEEALRRNAGWVPPIALGAEKASHHFIDLARAQTWRGDYDGALSFLQEARRRAPQHTRSHPSAREVVQSVLRRARRASDVARGLALWLGVTP
jgi:transcriptional regulator with XRE-family HTH domain